MAISYPRRYSEGHLHRREDGRPLAPAARRPRRDRRELRGARSATPGACGPCSATATGARSSRSQTTRAPPGRTPRPRSSIPEGARYIAQDMYEDASAQFGIGWRISTKPATLAKLWVIGFGAGGPRLRRDHPRRSLRQPRRGRLVRAEPAAVEPRVARRQPVRGRRHRARPSGSARRPRRAAISRPGSTPSWSIRAIPTGCSSPSRPRASSRPATAGRRGTAPTRA